MASDDELIQGMEQVSRACLTDRERRFVVEAIAEVRELRRDKARLAALCKWVSERDCEFSVEELIAIADEELAESTDKLRHAEAEIERLRAQADEALGIQERNFGHGSDTHMELHSWAKRVREARGDG